VKDVARFFKVLADESRLRMLWLLFHHRELCVCDIMEALQITQSKASRHLATLRHAGLVNDRREAAWSYYSLCPAPGEIERVVLDALRARLRAHAEGDRALRDLNAWLARKKNDLSCGSGGGCDSSGHARTKRPDRAARTGGIR